MKIYINENRGITPNIITAGTMNENNSTDLTFVFSDTLLDYHKRIVFITPDGNKQDLIEGNTYSIKSDITKYQSVNAYLLLTKDDKDWRSIEMTITFNHNKQPDEYIPTEEHTDLWDTMITVLDDKVSSIDQLSSDLQDLINIVQTKLDNGEFNYVLTEEDKTDIANMATPIVENNLKPILNNNLKESKDYTDNSISRDFKDITYDKATATFVFTRHDNTTFTVDLPIEQTVKNGYYDDKNTELVLVLISDQEIRIPASGLIDDYTGVDSATIQCVISADNKITCNIVSGSITKTLLTTELQEEINNKINKSSFVYDETTETLSINI